MIVGRGSKLPRRYHPLQICLKSCGFPGTHRRYCPKGKRRQRRAGIRRMRPGWSCLRVSAQARLLYGKSAR